MMKNKSSDVAMCESDRSSTAIPLLSEGIGGKLDSISISSSPARISIMNSEHVSGEGEGRKKSMKEKQISEEEGLILTWPRQRKKSKYLSPPYTVMVMKSVILKGAVKADPPSEAFNDDDPLAKVIACFSHKFPKRKRTTNVAVISPGIVASGKQDSDRENHVAVAAQGDQSLPKKAILVIRFTPGSAYPSKEELVKVFCEFGQVNEAETEAMDNVGCARVVFLNSTDCEKAFKGFDKINFFGYSVASYRLRYCSFSSSKAGAAKPISHPSAGDGAAGDQAPLECIKKKLDCIMSTLTEAAPGAHLSSEIRSSLMEEFTGLLEKITNLLKSATS